MSVSSMDNKVEFKAIDLLNSICDALVKYRVRGTDTTMAVDLELPQPTFAKFVSEVKEVRQNIDVENILYGNFTFCITEMK